jgi:glycosyltransferase involved in cell wall biosynthesis
MFRSVSGAISTGTLNREFYLAHGMEPHRIAHGVYPADHELFGNIDRRVPDADSAHTFVIGYAGKLLPRKGVDELLRAVALLGSDIRWRLDIIGDGPQKVNLEDIARHIGIAEKVRFLGFRNQTEMPVSLANLDLLVIPSTRNFRVLIAAEAMSIGIPVIVSSGTAVWGEGDLVESGVTGWAYQSGDVGQLAELLSVVAQDAGLRRRIADEGRRRSADQTAFTYANTVEAAVQIVAQEGPESLWRTRVNRTP